MDGVTYRRESSHFMIALPVLADITALVVVALWLPILSLRLALPAGWNAFLLVALYLLFNTAVYLIRKLQPRPDNRRWAPPSWLLDRRLRAVLALLFGLLVMSAVAYQLGFFASVQEQGGATLAEGTSAAFFVFGPGAWLAFSMLYILVLAFPVQESFAPLSNRYALIAALGLILGHGLFLFAAAQARAWRVTLGFFDGPGGLSLVFFGLLLAFLPPRLLYLDRQPAWPGWVTFALLLVVTTAMVDG
jgi:hypothetical protein